jgi:hypothetical protein
MQGIVKCLAFSNGYTGNKWEKLCVSHMLSGTIYTKLSSYSPGQAFEGSRRWRLREFKKNQHVKFDKVVSRMNRPPLSTGDTSGAYIRWRLSRPKGESAAGGMGLIQ